MKEVRVRVKCEAASCKLLMSVRIHTVLYGNIATGIVSGGMPASWTIEVLSVSLCSVLSLYVCRLLCVLRVYVLGKKAWGFSLFAAGAYCTRSFYQLYRAFTVHRVPASWTNVHEVESW